MSEPTRKKFNVDEMSAHGVRAHVRAQRRPMLSARAAGGAAIILAGVVLFSAAKAMFEPATPLSWYLPFGVLGLLQLMMIAALQRPIPVDKLESFAFLDVVAACGVIAWGGAASGRTHSAQLFLVGLAMSAAALVPWGPKIQAALCITVLAATQANVYMVSGGFLSGLAFPTLVPVVVLLAASIYVSYSLDRTRLAAGREELRRIAAEAEAVELNELLADNVAARTADYRAVNRELENFTYSVAHDLRAPLRSMDGFAAAVLDDYGDRLDEDGRDYLSRISASAQKLGVLIDDLLKLSQVVRVKIERREIDLSKIYEESFAQWRETDPSRRVEIKVAPGMIAEGDAALLRLAIDNLVGNAWKFTRNEDPAIIECGRLEEDGGYVYFIKDNGVGFDETYAAKLFKVFERLHVDRQFEGTGVGLATVRQVVERHGGRVWAESEPGKGAAFYFTLH